MNKIILTFLLVLLSKPALAFNKVSSECLYMHVIDNAPIGYYDEQGRAKGVHWDYIEAIAKESNLCINIHLFPYARIWKSLENGAHDGGIVFSSPSHSNFVEHIAEIRTIQTVVVPHKNIKINRYEDLHHIIIGKTRGTKLSDRFDNDNKLNIVEVKTYTDAALMLKSGRIDAIAGSAVVLTYQLNLNNALHMVDLSNKFILGSRTQWLQMSKKSQNLNHAPALRKAVNSLKQKGVLDNIMTKYYGEHWRLVNQ